MLFARVYVPGDLIVVQLDNGMTKFQVALAPVLLALSMHWTDQLWLPTAILLIVKIVAVLLRVLALLWLNVPSRKIEQFIEEDRLSTAVKLKATVDEFNVDAFAGELRVTTGAVVSTVKFLATLTPVLLALSAHWTDQ